MLIIIVISIILYYFIFNIVVIPKPKHEMSIYFGIPGSGKTTFAAYLAKESLRESRIIKFANKYQEKSKVSRWLIKTNLFKRSTEVYSNVPITGTFQLDAQNDIGRYMIIDSKIIIDEAGIEYNNRNFKQFSGAAIKFYKYHRHYQTSVDIFSQSYDDMDITLRRLAKNLFIVKKSLIPYFIVIKRINRRIGCDESHQIIDMYDLGIPVIETKHVFTPPLWKLFNSYSRDNLPEKEFERW